MTNDGDQRIQIISKMLFELANGNFFYRIQRTTKDDEIEALTVTLNMLAEEMEEVMIHQGYTIIDRPLIHVVQMSFILDKNGTIKSVNQQACNILSSHYKDLVNQPFIKLLTNESQVKWQKHWEIIKDKRIFDTKVDLKFLTKANLEIPKTAYISKINSDDSRSGQTLITIVHHSKIDKVLDKKLHDKLNKHSDTITDNNSNKGLNKKIRLTYDDIRKIREGHDIIINNLDKDLPLLKDFALQIGTNEFKLKYGFKELYGTTVHRFLMQERLRKAQMLIQHSDTSLKSIAYMVGFKSMPHFSRSFKKRYGYSPSSLRKYSNTGNN